MFTADTVLIGVNRTHARKQVGPVASPPICPPICSSAGWALAYSDYIHGSAQKSALLQPSCCVSYQDPLSYVLQIESSQGGQRHRPLPNYHSAVSIMASAPIILSPVIIVDTRYGADGPVMAPFALCIPMPT